MWQWRQRLECYIYKPRNTKNRWQHQKLRERHGTDSLWEHSVTAWPSNTLISDLKLLKLWANKFLLFSVTQFVVICYSSHRKQIQWTSCMWITWVLVNEFWDDFTISAQDHCHPLLLKERMSLNKKRVIERLGKLDFIYLSSSLGLVMSTFDCVRTRKTLARGPFTVRGPSPVGLKCWFMHWGLIVLIVTIDLVCT